MDKKDIQRIRHIKEYCEEINETVHRYGNDYGVFENDKDFYKSIAMSLFQIGELTVNLSEEFKETTKEQIPWSAIRGLRNIFAHDYGRINKKFIWETATSDVKELLEFCEGVISENSD